MDLYNNWPEIGSVFLLFIAFIFVVVTIKSLFMCILLVFMWGMIFGRIWYKSKHSSKLHWIFLIVGFIIGYIFASILMGYNHPLVLIGIYILGIWISYFIHDSGIIKSSQY